MSYRQFKPHPALSAYIDAYWLVEGSGNALHTSNILPDGCVDLIFNLDDQCRNTEGTITMESEKTYLIGTMTTFKTSCIGPDNKLIGVRFKPAAFSSFFRFAPLHEITDLSIDFKPTDIPEINKLRERPVQYLNHYFLNRLIQPRHNLLDVAREIEQAKGQLPIHELAKRNYITTRQLERHFQRYVGTSPKEFANIIRFRNAHALIKRNKEKRSLLTIAFECGYYDHAHLTNDIKRYTGLTPSQL
ncbi:AraC family transcriptional regulator [Chitinophaga rhizophila]|uniref:Helix-turn-helix domain-containing protein n=1 Tax=Chitinophaga rhizophila TaxID=2866212 RepID=A0ABS7GG29_9BACT|nr:helix-turn-helix domain-containing protein [Chitinophaga rhizophila]MBW8686643.1 helix-turn-helix domain-containing protein [Chitinophaga rhizophila]